MVAVARRRLLLGAVAAPLLALAGCGRRGPLRLPEPEASSGAKAPEAERREAE